MLLGSVALSGQQSGSGPAYRAFISYSHVDLSQAVKVHRQLERYRLPSRLVGAQTGRGSVPARLTPIFRDVDELPASNDLNAEIKGALAASGALIVLCSPDARASRWVNREIELFREMHGDSRPVLAALIKGEPEESFPVALMAGGAEPIAADFRSDGDGNQLARLKLVAGLTGVSLNQLVQRDAQARVRRVMAVTGVALAALLVMAALLVAALRARSEADHQRAEAEGLVEYMLTDLRTRLKGVGRLDVMTAVNERAMTYYAADNSLKQLPPDSLTRRARILHALGEDDAARGDMSAALSKFREAHRTTAAVVAKLPGDADALFAHAQSEFWVGDAANRLEDRPTTERHWQAYLVQAQALARVEPGSTRALMEQGYAHGNICAFLQSDPEQRAAAMVHCRKSVAFEEAALEREPRNTDILSALANRYGWIALVDLKEKRTADALANRAKEAALIERLLSQDPANVDYGLRRSWNDLGMAKALAETGRPAQAAMLSAKAVERLDRLIARGGATVPLLEMRIKCLVGQITYLKSAGNPDWRPLLVKARTSLAAFAALDRGGKTPARMEALLLQLEHGGTGQ